MMYLLAVNISIFYEVFNLLPIFIGFSLYKLQCIFEYEFFVINVWKCFFSYCGLTSHFLNSVFWRIQVFNFSFIISAFCVLFKKSLPTQSSLFYNLFSFYTTILNSVDLYSSSLIFLILCQMYLEFKYQVSQTFPAQSSISCAAKGADSFKYHKLSCIRI